MVSLDKKSVARVFSPFLKKIHVFLLFLSLSLSISFLLYFSISLCTSQNSQRPSFGKLSTKRQAGRATITLHKLEPD